MGHLSPLSGGFPFKDQHNRSAVVALDEEGVNTGIKRGMVIRVNTDGEFEIASDTSIKPMYLALQDYDDLQAIFAGNFSIGKGVPPAKGSDGDHKLEDHPVITRNAPKITGIHMDDGDVWETDAFDEGADYEIGTPLTVKDGLVTAGAEGDDCVGYVVKRPYTRYANDATLLPGMITGANIRVIAYQCGK